jgi:signal peptidase II
MPSVPKWRIALFFGLAIGGLALDLGTKYWIFGKLGLPGEKRPIVIVPPDIFAFETSLNEGALFGVGQGMWIVFSVLACFAAIGITYWFFRGGAGLDTWLTIALGCVTAGILGNLYDRVGLHGIKWPEHEPRAGQTAHAVRDWLHFQLRSIDFDWAVFNIADSLLVAGAIMLFWHAIWREPRMAKNAKPQP